MKVYVNLRVDVSTGNMTPRPATLKADLEKAAKNYFDHLISTGSFGWNGARIKVRSVRLRRAKH